MEWSRGGIILKILSIDTSSNICSVAVLDDNQLIKEISLGSEFTLSCKSTLINRQTFDILVLAYKYFLVVYL